MYIHLQKSLPLTLVKLSIGINFVVFRIVSIYVSSHIDMSGCAYISGVNKGHAAKCKTKPLILYNILERPKVFHGTSLAKKVILKSPGSQGMTRIGYPHADTSGS